MWHDSYVLVVLAVAALAVLGCVVAVALGHGGEMAEFPPDVPPLELPEAGRLTAVDFMSLRLPVSLVGYHTQTVDETLRRVATALSERDTRIAILEQRLAELHGDRPQARGTGYAGAARPPRTEHLPQPPQGEPTEIHGGAAAVAFGATRPLASPDGVGGEGAVRNGTAAAESAEEPRDGVARAARDGSAREDVAEDAAEKDAPEAEPEEAARRDSGEQDAREDARESAEKASVGPAGRAGEEKETAPRDAAGSGGTGPAKPDAAPAGGKADAAAKDGAGKGASGAAPSGAAAPAGVDPLEGEDDW